MKRPSLFLIGCGLLMLSCTRASTSTTTNESRQQTATARRQNIHRGVNWVAGREVSDADLEPLSRMNVNWIAQTPFGWMTGVDDPQVRLVTAGRVYWGEQDAGLEATTRLARARGIRIMLKPHIWVRGAKWSGEIAMKSEGDWDLWFASYRTFILHYAALAERLEIEALCIGTELGKAATENPEAWRRLIKEIRTIYHGPMTYAANWHDDFEKIAFWGDLDFIGIQAYFPLSANESPSLDELETGWKPHTVAIGKLAADLKKPVIITEVGYRSDKKAAIEPWKWDERSAKTDDVDLETQARCYEAFFRAVSGQPWFAGSYFWKWFPNHERAGGAHNAGFTPQNKPAQDVMARWYARLR